MLELNKNNWKCKSCVRYKDVHTPCVIDGDTQIYPDMRLEPYDECQSYITEDMDFTVNLDNPEKIVVSYNAFGKKFSGIVNRMPDWDETTVKVAILKAKEKIVHEIGVYQDQLNAKIEEQPDETQDDRFENIMTRLEDLIDRKSNELQTTNPEQEAMLDGDTEISWFERVTSWKRVLNAARRTIGREQLDKEPSDSWKAKILLAEHSPIRLLDYDFGWKKIRQWVTAHFVRHHQGCEKFVHSQRGDRRELPCDRDHIYQGAKNDMDMTVNAQSFINISRKRCCMCASKETRDAWAMVLNELEKVDPVLRSKCVRECVYRGFCPEWMSDCKYCYSAAYWLELAQYRNTRYGNDETWKDFEYLNGVEISNIGRVRVHGEIYPIKANADGAYVTIANDKYYIRRMMDQTYNTAGMEYIDGNKYNNALSNLRNGK